MLRFLQGSVGLVVHVGHASVPPLGVLYPPPTLHT
jgi:hypothetical protein